MTHVRYDGHGPTASMRWNASLGWIIALVIFAASLGLYSQNNEFAYYYHPDEKGKVVQVANHTRNYNHPLLLLSTTQLVTSLVPIEPTHQNIVVIGRWVAAAFASIAVAALALLAHSLYGPASAIAVGVAVAMNRKLFQLAHYMKEDTALIAGIALTFLALHYFWKTRTVKAAVLLGAASAVALSGKYVGAAMLLLVLPMVYMARPGQEYISRGQRIGIFFGGFVVILGVLNYSIFQNPGGIVEAVSRESTGVMTGQGLPRDIPHAVYVEGLLRYTPIPACVCAVIYCGLLYYRRREASPVEWLLPGFALLYATALSFSPLAAYRYLLPTLVLVTAIAAMGGYLAIHLVLRKFTPGWVAVIVAALASGTLMAAVQKKGIRKDLKAFQRDDRKELIAFIRSNLPPDAVIAQDGRAALPTVGKSDQHPTESPLPNLVQTREFVADLGTIEELQKGGVHYVLICGESYYFYTEDDLKPLPGPAGERCKKRRDFYTSLLETKEPIWQRKHGGVHYLQPGLKLYEIAKPSQPLPARRMASGQHSNVTSVPVPLPPTLHQDNSSRAQPRAVTK